MIVFILFILRCASFVKCHLILSISNNSSIYQFYTVLYQQYFYPPVFRNEQLSLNYDLNEAQKTRESKAK